MELNDAIKEAYEYAPPDVAYFDTLEFTSDGLTEPIRVVRSAGLDPLVTNQGTFLPFFFDFNLPETKGSVCGQMTITVRGITDVIRKNLRAASQSSGLNVKYRQYLTVDADPSAELPIPLSIVEITETFDGVEATAMVPDLSRTYFPKRLMNESLLFKTEEVA